MTMGDLYNANDLRLYESCADASDSRFVRQDEGRGCRVKPGMTLFGMTKGGPEGRRKPAH